MVTVELSPRFAKRIDAAAQKRGLTSAEDYLAQWHWSDEQGRDGGAREVAEAVKAELERTAGQGQGQGQGKLEGQG